jgi:dienelactone hydrolase
MRFVLAVALATLAVTPAALAASDKVLDQREIAALEAKAAQAAPKEQCFLYAELAHSMTELASQQLSAGDPAKASASHQAVQTYAEKKSTPA